MRSIIGNWFGRGRRIEARLAATEKTVSDILDEAKAIHAAISQAMKNKAAEIDAAVAKAKAAWEADDEADHAAALAELQAIRAELDNPPPFSPSAN